MECLRQIDNNDDEEDSFGAFADLLEEGFKALNTDTKTRAETRQHNKSEVPRVNKNNGNATLCLKKKIGFLDPFSINRLKQKCRTSQIQT